MALEYKQKCTNEHRCPWGTKPMVGMWSPETNLFATNCILYTHCPRKDWSKQKWQTHKNKKK